MKAFLLAAGFGERLRPLTDTCPKPLLPVLNVPAICYTVSMLKEAGIIDVVCNLHHRGGDIAEFFGRHDNFGLNLAFSLEEEILGTGGGLMRCRDHFCDSDFVLINSDIIADVDLRSLINDHAASGAAGTISVSRDFGGRATVAASGKRVADINGLLESGLSPEYDYIGMAVLSPEIFRYLSEEFSCIVRTGYRELARREVLALCKHDGFWHDIGTLESYRETNIGLIEKAGALKAGVSLHTGMAPHEVSADAAIGKGAAIERSVIGTGVTVGEGSLVSGSVILPGSAVGRGERVVNRVLWNG